MNLHIDREDWDGEDAPLDANGRPRPTRSRSSKSTRQHKPKARRTSGTANSAAKRGMHQRRNRRLTW